MGLASKCRLLFTAALMWSIDAAFAGDESIEYVVPDRAYVESECTDVEATLRWALADTRLSERMDAARARALATQLREICMLRQRNAISADTWLARFDAAYAAFAGAVFRCTGGDHCLQQSITSRQPLPTNLASYSVFLFTDKTWLMKSKGAEIEAIHDAFKGMGDSLGQTKGTIWLATTSDSVQPDVERGKALADVFLLDYNQGPYVVTTTIRPDLAGDDSAAIVVRLKGIAPERIVSVLNVLEQDLRRGTAVRREALLIEEIWQRLRSLSRGSAHPALDDVEIDFTARRK